MIKVAYSVTKYSGNESLRMAGIGKIEDNDLVLKNGKRLEDVIKKCSPIPYKENEFKGNYDEFEEIEVETKFGNYTTIELQTDYKIWYKVLKDTFTKKEVKETITVQETTGDIDDEIFG